MNAAGPAPPRIAAFFDFDRTVVDVDGGVLFGRELIRIYERRIRDERPGTLGWLGRVARWRLRILGLLALGFGARLLYGLRIIRRSTLVNVAYRALRGLPVEELRYLARDFVDEVLVHHAYPGALERMRWHREQGHWVIIATTNMRLLVEHFKAHAPVDDVIGTELVAQGGRATGRITGPRYGAEKAEAIRAYAHRRGISLPRSYAYTDHYSDHFILPLVGHPVAVNARGRLRRLAKRRRYASVQYGPPPRPPEPRAPGSPSRPV